MKQFKSFLSAFGSALTVVALIFIAPAPAHAVFGTTVLAVSVTVLAECLVATTPLAFGTYSVDRASPTDATGSIITTCTYGTPYTISLDAGTGTGATMAVRKMKSGSNTLNYAIYTGSNHASIWGDGSASTSTMGATAGLLPDTYPVYGRIPPTQQSPTGIYTDAVTVTLTY